MTISSEVGRKAYAGDGVSVAFATTFKFFANSDLKVVKQSSAGVDSTLTENVHYTATGAGNENGGTVTMVTAPASGEKLTIILNPVLTQLTDYVSNDAFAAESHERALDRRAQGNIRVKDMVERAVRVPDGDVLPLTTLPGAAARAEKYLRFDVNGDVEVAELADSGLISLSQSILGAFLWPQSSAETAASVTPRKYHFDYGRSERNGLGDGSTDYDVAFADLFSGAYPDVKIQSGTFDTSGLTIDIHAGIVSGSGIETRITATGAHTITLPADKQDTHLRDIWVDQLDAAGQPYDAIHALGGEWHLSDIDIDFAPRNGIYVGAYRTQIEKVQFQAVLGTCLTSLNTAFRCQANQLIFENAGTPPGNGVELTSEHWNVTDVTSFQQDGWTAQASGSYNTVQGVTAIGPGGATAENFINITGTFNAFSCLIGRGVTGIGLNLTGNSNVAQGVITSNTSKQALVISGNNALVSGRFFNAGTGGTFDAVAISGNSNRVDLDAGTHTGTYDANVTGANNELRGICTGAVRLTGAQNAFYGQCRNLVVQGDPTPTTAGFARLDVTVTGAEAIGADIQGNSAGGRVVCVNAGAAGVRIGGSNCELGLRVFNTNASGTAIEIDGSRNSVNGQVSGTGAGGNDLVIDGDNNEVSGTYQGNVVINGNRNKLTATITGNLTIDGDVNYVNAVVTGDVTINAGATNNRVAGVCEGTLTDNGTTSNTSDLT